MNWPRDYIWSVNSTETRRYPDSDSPLTASWKHFLSSGMAVSFVMNILSLRGSACARWWGGSGGWGWDYNCEQNRRCFANGFFTTAVTTLPTWRIPLAGANVSRTTDFRAWNDFQWNICKFLNESHLADGLNKSPQSNNVKKLNGCKLNKLRASQMKAKSKKRYFCVKVG